MSSGSNTTTTDSSPPADVTAAFDQATSAAEQAASAPLTQYQGQTVAQLSPDQVAAFTQVEQDTSNGGVQQPYLQAAQTDINNTATGLDPANFAAGEAAYQSPELTGAGTIDPSDFQATQAGYQSPYATGAGSTDLADFQNTEASYNSGLTSGVGSVDPSDDAKTMAAYANPYVNGAGSMQAQDAQGTLGQYANSALTGQGSLTTPDAQSTLAAYANSALTGQGSLTAGNVANTEATYINPALTGKGSLASSNVQNTLGNYINPNLTGAGSLDASDFGNTESAYQSPYTQQVLNTTEASEMNTDAQQQQQIAGNATSQGAFGGDRLSVAQGIAAGQQAIANNQTNAGIEQAGFGAATAAAESNQAAQQQGYSTAATTAEAQAQLQQGAYAQAANTASTNLGLQEQGFTEQGQMSEANLGLQEQGYTEAGTLALGQEGAEQAAINSSAQQAQYNETAQQGAYNNATQAAQQNENTMLGAYNSGTQEANANEQLQQAGFVSSTATDEANQYLQSQAASGEENLGSEVQSTDLSGASALLQTGTLEQQQAQNMLNVPYEQYQAAEAYPFQTVGYEANILEGLGSAAGGTSSTTSPGASALSGIGGLAAGSAGLAGSIMSAYNNSSGAGNGPGAGTFDTGNPDPIIPPTSTGSYVAAPSSNPGDNRGGAVGMKPRFAVGGMIPHYDVGGALDLEDPLGNQDGFTTTVDGGTDISVPNEGVSIVPAGEPPGAGRGDTLLKPSGSTSTGSGASNGAATASSAVSMIGTAVQLAAMFAQGGRVTGHYAQGGSAYEGLQPVLNTNPPQGMQPNVLTNKMQQIVPTTTGGGAKGGKGIPAPPHAAPETNPLGDTKGMADMGKELGKDYNEITGKGAGKTGDPGNPALPKGPPVPVTSSVPTPPPTAIAGVPVPPDDSSLPLPPPPAPDLPPAARGGRLHRDSGGATGYGNYGSLPSYADYGYGSPDPNAAYDGSGAGGTPSWMSAIVAENFDNQMGASLANTMSGTGQGQQAPQPAGPQASVDPNSGLPIDAAAMDLQTAQRGGMVRQHFDIGGMALSQADPSWSRLEEQQAVTRQSKLASPLSTDKISVSPIAGGSPLPNTVVSGMQGPMAGPNMMTHILDSGPVGTKLEHENRGKGMGIPRPPPAFKDDDKDDMARGGADGESAATPVGTDRHGLLASPIAGRTDKLEVSPVSGSYVVPADVISGMGQGNTAAGANVMQRMLDTGPNGLKMDHERFASKGSPESPPAYREASIDVARGGGLTGFADGGGLRGFSGGGGDGDGDSDSSTKDVVTVMRPDTKADGTWEAPPEVEKDLKNPPPPPVDTSSSEGPRHAAHAEASKAPPPSPASGPSWLTGPDLSHVNNNPTGQTLGRYLHADSPAAPVAAVTPQPAPEEDIHSSLPPHLRELSPLVSIEPAAAAATPTAAATPPERAQKAPPLTGGGGPDLSHVNNNPTGQTLAAWWNEKPKPSEAAASPPPSMLTGPDPTPPPAGSVSPQAPEHFALQQPPPTPLPAVTVKPAATPKPPPTGPAYAAGDIPVGAGPGNVPMKIPEGKAHPFATPGWLQAGEFPGTESGGAKQSAALVGPNGSTGAPTATAAGDQAGPAVPVPAPTSFRPTTNAPGIPGTASAAANRPDKFNYPPNATPGTPPAPISTSAPSTAAAAPKPAAVAAAAKPLVQGGQQNTTSDIPLQQRAAAAGQTQGTPTTTQTAQGTPPTPPSGGATPITVPPGIRPQNVPPHDQDQTPNTKAVVPESQRQSLLANAVRGTSIPPALLNAIVMQESSWDVNTKGANGGSDTGLMQILSTTAAAPGYGMKGVDISTLSGPQNAAANLAFGVRYLQGIGDKMGMTAEDWKDPNKVAAVLRAYNGGGDKNYVNNVLRYMPAYDAQGIAKGTGVYSPGAYGSGAPSTTFVGAQSTTGGMQGQGNTGGMQGHGGTGEPSNRGPGDNARGNDEGNDGYSNNNGRVRFTPKEEKADPWLALAQAGFAMAAGRSPHALQNIGAGALAGVKSYTEQKAAADKQNLAAADVQQKMADTAAYRDVQQNGQTATARAAKYAADAQTEIARQQAAAAAAAAGHLVPTGKIDKASGMAIYMNPITQTEVLGTHQEGIDPAKQATLDAAAAKQKGLDAYHQAVTAGKVKTQQDLEDWRQHLALLGVDNLEFKEWQTRVQAGSAGNSNVPDAPKITSGGTSTSTATSGSKPAVGPALSQSLDAPVMP